MAFFLVHGLLAAQSGSGGGDDSQITAADGRRLESEPIETLVMFQSARRNDAGLGWAEQHTAEIDHIQHLDTDSTFVRRTSLRARGQRAVPGLQADTPVLNWRGVNAPNQLRLVVAGHQVQYGQLIPEDARAPVVVPPP